MSVCVCLCVFVCVCLYLWVCQVEGEVEGEKVVEEEREKKGKVLSRAGWVKARAHGQNLEPFQDNLGTTGTRAIKLYPSHTISLILF